MELESIATVAGVGIVALVPMGTGMGQSGAGKSVAAKNSRWVAGVKLFVGIFLI